MPTSKELLEMAEKISHQIDLFNNPMDAEIYIDQAAAMLRDTAKERETLRRLLYDIHPDPQYETVEKYYKYFEANPMEPSK